MHENALYCACLYKVWLYKSKRMLTQFHPSKVAAIIQCRSAFSLYLRKGLEEVEKRYPDSVEFVKQHSNKSLLEVTNILTEQLNTSASSYSETPIPVSAK